MYKLIFASRAERHLLDFEKSGDKPLMKKVRALFEELKKHPETGTGKPERLKGNRSGLWSRRITDKHRMVYRIENMEITVYVLSLSGHYDDR